jgi:hypothetical protein
MQARCLRRYFRIFWFVLTIAIASFCVFVWTQGWEETSLSSAQFPSDSPPAPADFDGDRVVDPLTLDRTGWQLSMEIHLSHTREVSVIPLDPSLSVAGSLTVRDLDNDGDTDLFWKGALPLAPPEVVVWFNDGTGRFARLLSLNSPQTRPTPGCSLKKDSCRVGSHHEVLPSKRTSSPASLPTSDWTWQASTSVQREQLIVVPLISFLKRYPSDRGPPTLF